MSKNCLHCRTEKEHELRTKVEKVSTLNVKLASIVVHIEEYFSPNGHPFDKVAIESLLNDAEIKQFIGQMQMKGLLPEKRK